MVHLIHPRKSFRRVSLLVASFVGQMALTTVAGAGTEAKVEICHFPPGEPANFQTIAVSAEALPAHLAHGDFGGPCANDCRLFSSVCDDGNPCTSNGCNSDGTCQQPVPRDCDDSNVCTADSCDASTGACVNSPLGGTCDDGNECTGPDTCASGRCVGLAIPGCCRSVADCDDSNACTDDACTANTCSNTPRLCTDPDLCTRAVCNQSTGLCVNTPVSCDDQSACTTDSCNLSTGLCEHPFVDCDDGDPNTFDPCSSTDGCLPPVLIPCDLSITCECISSDRSCLDCLGSLSFFCDSARSSGCQDPDGNELCSKSIYDAGCAFLCCGRLACF